MHTWIHDSNGPIFEERGQLLDHVVIRVAVCLFHEVTVTVISIVPRSFPAGLCSSVHHIFPGEWFEGCWQTTQNWSLFLLPERPDWIQRNATLWYDCMWCTVNREYFDIKIFSDSIACAKIKCMKYMHNINDNAVQGRLSENYLTWKIIAWNSLDTKYSRFTVYTWLPVQWNWTPLQGYPWNEDISLNQDTYM